MEKKPERKLTDNEIRDMIIRMYGGLSDTDLAFLESCNIKWEPPTELRYSSKQARKKES